MGKFFRIIAHAWFVFFGVVFSVSSVMIVYKDGFWAYAQIINPFDVANFIAVVLSLSPGIGAWLLAGWLENRKPPESED